MSACFVFVRLELLGLDSLMFRNNSLVIRERDEFITCIYILGDISENFIFKILLATIFFFSFQFVEITIAKNENFTRDT